MYEKLIIGKCFTWRQIKPKKIKNTNPHVTLRQIMCSNSRLESENRTNNRSKNSTADDKTKQTPTDGPGFYERGQREVYLKKKVYKYK